MSDLPNRKPFVCHPNCHKDFEYTTLERFDIPAGLGGIFGCRYSGMCLSTIKPFLILLRGFDIRSYNQHLCRFPPANFFLPMLQAFIEELIRIFSPERCE
ncbi:MAG: hypothetical protein GWO23_03245 [Gammaproteobacteria bacterium]|nr:hypothetical protein [Gammaproteobacteria bacterium]